MGLPVDLKSILDGFYKSLGLNLSGLDYEEQDKRRAYENNMFNSGRNRANALTSGAVNSADRGLSRSGIALQQAANINQASDESNAGVQQGFSSDLATIARKRVMAESDYNTKKLELERQATAQQEIVPPLPISVAPSLPSENFNPVIAAQKAISTPVKPAQASKKVATVVPKKAIIGRNSYS